MELLLIAAFVLAAVWLGRPRRLPKKGAAEPSVERRPLPARPRGDDPLERARMFADVSAKARYKRRPLLHPKEFELLTKLEQRVVPGGTWKLRRTVRVLPQVSLGEALGVERTEGSSEGGRALAQSAINSKRIDLLLTCHYCHPRVAIELQGWRHASDPETILRDAAKRNALASAGIALVEIGADEAEDDYMPRIYRALADSYGDAFEGAGRSS